MPKPRELDLARLARQAVRTHAQCAQAQGGWPPSEAAERKLTERLECLLRDPMVYEASANHEAAVNRALNQRESGSRNPWRRAGLAASYLEAVVRSRCTDHELILELLMQVEVDEVVPIERVDAALRRERVEDYEISRRVRVGPRPLCIPRARSSCGGRRRPGRSVSRSSASSSRGKPRRSDDDPPGEPARRRTDVDAVAAGALA